jgi:hypothetical protein
MTDEREAPTRPPAPLELRPFIDDEGRLKQWPVKFSKQMVALEWLSQLFERSRDYTEPEVNDLLNTAHTFEDWAILRRGLCDHRWLERDPNGAWYRRTAKDAG